MATAESLTADSDPSAADEAQRITFVDRRPTMARTLRDAWANRRLWYRLSERALAFHYMRTKLGRTWIFIRPLVDGLARTVLFSGVLSIAAPDEVPYFLFLMVGMMTWMTFEQTLLWGGRGLERFVRIVRGLNVPLVLLPLAGGSLGMVFLVSYAAFIAVAIAWFAVFEGRMFLELGPQLLVGVLGVLLALLFAWGMSLWLSVLDARWWDVRNSLRYVVPVLMYLTPVVYPISKLGEPWQMLALVNPLAPMIEMTRYGLIGGADISLFSVSWAVGATAAMFTSGLWFFTRQVTAALELEPAGDNDDDLSSL